MSYSPRCCRPLLSLAAALCALLLIALPARAQSGTGACCRPGGACTIVDLMTCLHSSGSFLDGQTCTACSQTGACCVGTVCSVNTPGNCAGAGGFYFANSCTTNPCPSPNLTGSCCASNGGCVSLIQSNCTNGRTWTSSVGCSAAPCVPTGACCNLTACSVTTAAACPTSWFANTTCALVDCGPTGACCNAQTGVCIISTASTCPTSSTFISGATCDSAPCDSAGACCNRNNVCITASKNECASTGGNFTPGASCNPSPCGGPMGACCIPGQAGGCAFITKSDCPFGSTFSANAPCNPDPCPNTQGACCTASGCVIALATGCAGSFFPAQPCAKDLCPPVGACCNTAVGGCAVTSLATCMGNWYAAVTCSPDPCGVSGACCTLAGSCSSGAFANCNGTWLAKATCQPSPCPKGGCCNSSRGICVISSQYQCSQQGLSFLGSGIVCQPASCVVESGACCNGGTCVMATASKCAGVLIAGSTCKPNPCCSADFDGSNVVGVPDIFSFLSTWFAGCP